MTPLLPSTPLAARATSYVLEAEATPVANHSFRSYLFATLLAEHEGVDCDPDLLFFATVLHDLGTSPQASGSQRFEVDGADMAAAFLTEGGVGDAEVDRVWEAIALHTSPGIAERRGSLAYLTRRGIGIDFGMSSDFITDEQGAAIHGRYPRLRMAGSLVNEIARQAGRGQHNAPRYTLAGELMRERLSDPSGLTSIERATAMSRWGE